MPRPASGQPNGVEVIRVEADDAVWGKSNSSRWASIGDAANSCKLIRSPRREQQRGRRSVQGVGKRDGSGPYSSAVHDTRPRGLKAITPKEAEGEILCSNGYCLQLLSQLASQRFLRLLKHRRHRPSHRLRPPSRRRLHPRSITSTIGVITTTIGIGTAGVTANRGQDSSSVTDRAVPAAFSPGCGAAPESRRVREIGIEAADPRR
jgi:hypothetical protein